MSTPSLERLSEWVRQVDARSRAQKLGGEAKEAAERLRAAEERSRALEKALRDEKPARLRALEEAEVDERTLRELTRKVAQLISAAAVSPEEAREFEQQIGASRTEIETKRRENQAAVEVLMRDALEARRQLQAAAEQYQQLRREMERIQPQLVAEYSSVDRIARDAEQLFPAGQIHALSREIEDGAAHFGVLDPREQLAQLTIWIGKYRRMQASELADVPEEDQHLLRGLFPKLVGISKQYEPGYIEAFRQTFSTNWDDYIADAEEQLHQAMELSRRGKELESRRRDQAAREQEQKRIARANAQDAFDELRAVIARYNLPEDGVEQFQDALARVVTGFGAGDQQLLELAMPYRDLLTGAEFRAVRKHLDRMIQEESRDDDGLTEQFADLLSQTRGKKAIMIGGSPREDRRRTLQRVFEFDELDWENYEGNRPALLDSLEQRVRNRGFDLVLILRSFIAHHVPERLRPACEQNDIPCLFIDHGYGPAQVAETLRRALVKVEN